MKQVKEGKGKIEIARKKKYNKKCENLVVGILMLGTSGKCICISKREWGEETKH